MKGRSWSRWVGASLTRVIRNEAGVVLVEASLVSLLLLLMAAGILEYASLFSSANDTSSAVRSAARAGSITTSTGTVDSDYDIVQGLMTKAGSARNDITRLAIYRADAASSQVPAACKGPSLTVPPGTPCDVYDASDLKMSQAQIESLPASQRGWPEAGRSPGQDFLGVWVSVNRPRLFMNLVPSPSVYTDSFVMLINPRPSVSPSGGWSPSVVGLPEAFGTAPNWWCDGPSDTNCMPAGSGGDTTTGGPGGSS